MTKRVSTQQRQLTRRKLQSRKSVYSMVDNGETIEQTLFGTVADLELGRTKRRVLNSRELSDKYRWSLRYIYRLIKDYRLPHIKHEGRYFFEKEEIKNWMKTRSPK